MILEITEQEKINTISTIKSLCDLTQSSVDNLEKFVKLLLLNNQNFNLIGKSTIDDVWNRHILDSAQLIQYIDNKNQIIGDFGSGSGLPGIILSILGIKQVHLIEKSFRKCQFLKLASEISPNTITIHQKRVEEMNGLSIDIAVSRAFAPLSKLVPIVSPFLKKDGYSIFLKGRTIKEEINLAKESNKFHYVIHKSITADSGRVIIVS